MLGLKRMTVVLLSASVWSAAPTAAWSRTEMAYGAGGYEQGGGSQAVSLLGDPDDVSGELRSILAKHDVPGMVACVTTVEKTVLLGAAGVRARGAESEVNIRDAFHIGSCTKSMTATLAALLVQEGMLKWGTTVGESFPELPSEMHESWKNVTLEHLLTNRSGTPADLNADGLWGRLWNHTGSAEAQRATLVEALLKKPTAAAPGEKFIYSNAGFAIAGVMAERAAKQPWEELMRERVFGPLGMVSAGFGAPGEVDQETPDSVPATVWGHTEKGRRVAPGPAGTAGFGGSRSRSSDNPGAIGPAGTVHCSIEDWARYIRLHLRGASLASGNSGPSALGLPSEAFKKLHTAFDAADSDRYAMGWRVDRRAWAKGKREGDEGRVLTHAGSNTMWYCVAWLAPESEFAVLVMCNQGGDAAVKACDAAAGELIGRYRAMLKRGQTP